jgi:hypothetical protein
LKINNKAVLFDGLIFLVPSHQIEGRLKYKNGIADDENYKKSGGYQRVSFDAMAEPLQAILYQQLRKFQPLHDRPSGSPGT